MKQQTKLIQSGRGAIADAAGVNVPVHRASTIIYPDARSYLSRFDGDGVYSGVVYGALGTHNARALAQAVADLEQAAGTVVTASGLSACTLSLAAVLKQGDHVLITDSVYGPTRRFCSEVLSRFGVEVAFYDPSAGAEICALIRPETALIYMEAPGSLTFEMQDVPAIVAVAREHRVLTAMDNTWATPLYFNALAQGVDISIQAGTKYLAGHSDVIVGLISCADDSLYRRVACYAQSCGDVAGPDDCYLALRGLRTLTLRLSQQYQSALQVAGWLAEQAPVERVLYPPLENDPGHSIWKRSFSGGASLFGVTLKVANVESVCRLVDSLQHFKIGSSWGGFESLVAIYQAPLQRDIQPWAESELLLRFHVGLEDPSDLIEDLRRGLERI